MRDDARSSLLRKIHQVRRQLRNGSIVQALPFGWTAALLVWAVWLLARPFLPATLSALPIWTEAIITLMLGTLLGIYLGTRRAPTLHDAALAIDHECGLKERVVSALTLPAELAQTEVGQAVLEDARERLAQADLNRSFAPPQQSRDYLWPLLAGALACGAFFLGPRLGSWILPPMGDDGRPVINAKDVEQELENLRKVSAFEKNKELPRSKELEELGAEWDRMINKPIDPANQEQVRERAREIEDFKNKFKDAADKLAGKGKDMEDVLAQAFGENKGDKKGAADDLARALAKGDFAQAAEAVEKLQKKLRDKGLNKEEEQRLAEQLKDMENRLKRLLDPDQKRDQLAKDHKEGKLNDAELNRELEQLAEMQKNLEGLKDLADALKDLEGQMGQKGEGAMQKLEKLAGDLKKLQVGREDLEKMLRDLRRMEEAQRALCRLCQGQGQGKDGMAKAGNGMGAGKLPGGRRPIAEKDPDGKITRSPDRAVVDPKGKLRVVGEGLGGGMPGKIPAREVGGAIEAAVQEAPDIIERQRIPPEAADLARGYFKKLGGQK